MKQHLRHPGPLMPADLDRSSQRWRSSPLARGLRFALFGVTGPRDLNGLRVAAPSSSQAPVLRGDARMGLAWSFDGSDDVLIAGDAAFANSLFTGPGKQFSVTVDVSQIENQTAGSGGYPAGLIVGQYDNENGSNRSWGLWAANWGGQNYLEFLFFDTPNNLFAGFNSQGNLTGPHTLTVTYDGTQATISNRYKLYVDGFLHGTTAVRRR
jgi:hypothetical protein